MYIQPTGDPPCVHGVASYALSCPTDKGAAAVNCLLRQASDFFGQSDAIKQQTAGYYAARSRRVGGILSAVESMDVPVVEQGTLAFFPAAWDVCALIDDIVDRMLCDLAGPEFAFMASSGVVSALRLGQRELQIAHYLPPGPGQDVRVAPHHDSSLFTFLCGPFDGMERLEQTATTRHWLSMTTLAGTVSVIPGYLAEWMTKGRFRAMTHRVGGDYLSQTISLALHITPPPETRLPDRRTYGEWEERFGVLRSAA